MKLWEPEEQESYLLDQQKLQKYKEEIKIKECFDNKNKIDFNKLYMEFIDQHDEKLDIDKLWLVKQAFDFVKRNT